LIEPKATKNFKLNHAVQCINPLRGIGRTFCLLLNFVSPPLGIRRIVNNHELNLRLAKLLACFCVESRKPTQIRTRKGGTTNAAPLPTPSPAPPWHCRTRRSGNQHALRHLECGIPYSGKCETRPLLPQRMQKIMDRLRNQPRCLHSREMPAVQLKELCT
jgi:hypothetical protein